MADKEERITIHRVLYPCKKCSINCNKNDWKDCDFYQNYISGMTRQDVIERMTVAMCKFDCTDNERACENCNEWEKYDKCESLAEAALDALLGGKK